MGNELKNLYIAILKWDDKIVYAYLGDNKVIVKTHSKWQGTDPCFFYLGLEK